MNNESEDQDLQRLFHELRRSEANQSPPFARVRPASTTRERTPPAVLWRYALGTALAVAVLMVAATVIFRDPTSMRRQPARQPDAAALTALALRMISDWPDELPSLARWDSPTAFLLTPLATGSGSVPANSERN